MTEKSELKIPRIIFHNTQEIRDYFNEDNLDILIDIIDGIEQGYDMELNEVDIFEVEIATSNSVLLFILKEKEWVHELKEILRRVIEVEKYELADRISKLIKNVELRMEQKKNV